ncbi:MAG TPA: cyclase family protein [Acidimicrobiales bacterium]|nr:cyclase family protein [Acidimicrobiales bacterium]
MEEQAQVRPPEWILELAASRPFGEGDRRGTVNLIDDAARARAAASVRTGQTISLARPLRAGDYNATLERPGFAHEIHYHPTPDGMGWGTDHLVLDPHGLMNTHIDALNHVALNGTYYGGRPYDSPEQGSVDALAPHGLVARAVFVDIPALRGTGWADTPVTGRDIDGALDAAGLTFEPGDALCLDMGRDRFETASGHILGGPESDDDAGGGLSSDGARWVAEHAVSMLAWDMLDSRDAKATRASAHVLTWAIGLLLVDNCDFAALRAALGGGTQIAGALVVAPLVVEGANGVNLNPIVLR